MKRTEPDKRADTKPMAEKKKETTEESCEARVDATTELFEAAGSGSPTTSEAEVWARGRLWEHKRDIIAVVMIQAVISLVLVPCAQLAGKLHPVFALFVGVAMGSLILVGLRLLPQALDNMAFHAAAEAKRSAAGA